MIVLQIHVKIMVFVLIKKMVTPVAVHQDTADETVKSVTMSVCPLRPAKMEPNALPENSRITHVRVVLVGLANSAMNAKVSFLKHLINDDILNADWLTTIFSKRLV